MRLSIALFALVFVVGCGLAPSTDGSAATAAARLKEGVEAQRAPVTALETAQAAAAKAPPAVQTQLAAVAPTIQAAAGKTAQMTQEQATLMARTEVSRSIGVPVDQVTVERAEMVQWNDSSLGCREANKVYAQVITPGFRVVMNAGGQRREVHTDMTGRAVICQTPTQ